MVFNCESYCFNVYCPQEERTRDGTEGRGTEGKGTAAPQQRARPAVQCLVLRVCVFWPSALNRRLPLGAATVVGRAVCGSPRWARRPYRVFSHIACCAHDAYASQRSHIVRPLSSDYSPPYVRYKFFFCFFVKLLRSFFLSRALFLSRHFAQWEVDEEKVVESWISQMDTDRDVRELGAVKKSVFRCSASIQWQGQPSLCLETKKTAV